MTVSVCKLKFIIVIKLWINFGLEIMKCLQRKCETFIINSKFHVFCSLPEALSLFVFIVKFVHWVSNLFSRNKKIISKCAYLSNSSCVNSIKCQSKRRFLMDWCFHVSFMSLDSTYMISSHSRLQSSHHVIQIRKTWKEASKNSHASACIFIQWSMRQSSRLNSLWLCLWCDDDNQLRESFVSTRYQEIAED